MLSQDEIPNLSEIVEGSYETLPVRLERSGGAPEEYPLTYPVLADLDCDRLYADYQQLRPLLSSSYITDRKDFLGCSIDLARTYLWGNGFTKQAYSSIGLVKQGTAELLDVIPEYTRSVLAGFPGRSFRAHYSIAKPGWETKFHGDALRFNEIGFRINLPINVPAHYAFRVEGQTFDFELEKGKAWFVNFCRIHKGYNPTAQDRVSLILQLDSDQWLPVAVGKNPRKPDRPANRTT